MTRNATQLFSEGHQIDVIPPASRNDDEATTGWKSMRDWFKAAVLVEAGAIAAGGALDCKITQAQDAAGTGAKDITGKAITALGGGDDNGNVVIELDASELDVTNSFSWINVQLNAGGTVAILCSAVLLRFEGRFVPADTSGLAEVVN